MTEPDETKNGTTGNSPATGTTNTAYSTVAIQAEQVHNSNVYMVGPDASPEEEFTIGVKYLDGGVPRKARELIDKAIARGFDNGKARFHWVLAVLSKRSLGDLDAHDREQLRRLPERLARCADDEWKDALEVVGLLVTQADAPDSDHATAVAALDALPEGQRAMVVRHLDLVLNGTLKDQLWTEARQAAETARFGNDRGDRVWAYFQETPAEPRALVPGDEDSSPVDRVLAIAWSSVFLVASFALGRWALFTAPTPATVALVLATTAAVVAGFTGYGWHRRRVQLDARDRRHTVDPRTERVTEPGFRRQVDNRFRHYEIKFALPGAENDRWLAETRGIRATLRDEIAEIYPGHRTRQIDWLIRYHVRDVRNRWRTGTLRDYREQYRTRLRTRLWFTAALAVLALSLVVFVLTAAGSAPLTTALAGGLALVTGALATARWLRILGNRHRHAEAEEERARLYAARRAEHDRWTAKLASIMPFEEEMETWLDADRKMFLADTLVTYRLKWRQIVTYAALQAPASSYRRGRAERGPWRYSHYNLRLFLITEDGVREVGTELNFLKSTRRREERRNYRFDAVSSVQVNPDEESTYVLELVLTNGPPRKIVVTDPAPESVKDKETFAELNLEAAGFGHTLRILEGIAAEGKGWISRDRGRNGPQW